MMVSFRIAPEWDIFLIGNRDVKMKKNVVMLTLLLFSPVLFIYPEDRWEKFDKPPLTIIYPEETALSNPPFIHWQAHPAAHNYAIRLKNPLTELKWMTPHNFFTPVYDLAPGVWSVEITALDKDGKTLRTSRKDFRIARPGAGLDLDLNHLVFEKGTPFFPSAAIIESLHSGGPESSPYREKLIAYAREPMPPALLQMKEPARFTNNKWNIDEWRKKNDISFAVRGYILPQALAWRMTGERPFLDNAKKIALQVAEWDPRGGTGLWDDDHATQAILYSLSITYNLLKDEWTPAEKVKMVNCLRERTRDIYHFQNPFLMKKLAVGLMNDPDNNHPWFCTAALGFGALSLMGEEPEAETWLSFAAQLFYGVYFPRGGASGEWHEGIDYWSYTLYFVFQFNDALRAATGVDLYRHPWLKKTAFFKIYTHPPSGGYVPFGDSKNRPPDGFDKLVMMRLASVYNSPLDWRYVDAIPAEIKKGYFYDALFWDGKRPAGESLKVEAPFVYHYEDIGWVVSNNNIFEPEKRVLFAFRSGKVFGNGAHSHADQNHFVITAGSDRLIWDSGYYDWYGSPHHRSFTVTSRAHNTILIDGEGQRYWKVGVDGRITRFSLKGRSLTVQGDASTSAVYGGRVEKFLRTIQYENEKDFLVKDVIILRNAGRISWLLQSDFPIRYNAQDGAILIRGKQYQLSGRFETAVSVEATLIDKFPAPPEPASKQEPPRLNQYTLELKTKEAVREWSPRLVLSLSHLP